MPHHERKSSLTIEGEKVVCVERSGSLTIIPPPAKVESDRRRGSLLTRYFTFFALRIFTECLPSAYLTLNTYPCTLGVHNM